MGCSPMSTLALRGPVISSHCFPQLLQGTVLLAEHGAHLKNTANLAP